MTVSELQGGHDTAPERYADDTVLSKDMEHQSCFYTGVVVGRQDSFGFIKSPSLESRVYFSARDCDSKCRNGTKVEFVLDTDAKSGKMVAKHVRRVGGLDNAQPSKEEVEIPGIFTGVIQALPKASVDVHVDDGMISFIDHDGCQHQAMFGKWRVASVDTLCLGQPVEFHLALNPSTKVYKALNVRIDQVVVDAMEKMNIGCEDEREECQLGKVVLLKKEFGFIKRLGHASDLFFHFSEVDPKEEKLNVGDDIKFVVRIDTEGRAHACNIRRVPAGSVQFEVLSEDYYHGVVIEKPAMSKSYEKSPGVIDFVEQPLKGKNIHAKKDWSTLSKSKLLFYANENEGVQSLRNGDHIVFKIITDINAFTSAKLAGKDTLAQLIARRAAQIQPIRGTGTIVELKDHKKGSKGYGFLTWNGSFLVDTESVSKPGKSPQHRLFFQKSDLQQSETFQVGDAVYFTLHSNKTSEDMAATRIRMKEKAPLSTAKGDPVETERLPLKLQQRHFQAHQPSRKTTPTTMPLGPDGTRGFTMARGAYLREQKQNAEVDDDTLLNMCCGLKLKGIFPDLPRSLSIGAIPFNPNPTA